VVTEQFEQIAEGASGVQVALAQLHLDLGRALGDLLELLGHDGVPPCMRSCWAASAGLISPRATASRIERRSVAGGSDARGASGPASRPITSSSLARTVGYETPSRFSTSLKLPRLVTNRRRNVLCSSLSRQKSQGAKWERISVSHQVQ